VVVDTRKVKRQLIFTFGRSQGPISRGVTAGTCKSVCMELQRFSAIALYQIQLGNGTNSDYKWNAVNPCS
jgi:hypothetical protein